MAKKNKSKPTFFLGLKNKQDDLIKDEERHAQRKMGRSKKKRLEEIKAEELESAYDYNDGQTWWYTDD